MTEAAITFAIPFRGRLDHLQQALQSVLAQDDPRWRAIVVDDANPDPGAAALVADLNDPRATCLRNAEPLGMAANWNHAARLAETPLVTLLHGDDLLEPHYASLMIAAHARRPEAAAVFCEATTIDDDGHPRASVPDLVKRRIRPHAGDWLQLRDEAGARALLRGNFIVCPTLCYRSDLFRTTGFDSRLRWVPDLAFTLALLFEGKTIVGAPDIGYRYRRHQGQATVRLESQSAMIEEEVGLWAWAAGQAARRHWHDAESTACAMRIVAARAAWLAGRELMAGRPRVAVRRIMGFLRERQAALAGVRPPVRHT